MGHGHGRFTRWDLTQYSASSQLNASKPTDRLTPRTPPSKSEVTVRRILPYLSSALVAIGLAGIMATTATASTAQVPTVTGSFDQAPHIIFPNAKAPSNLVVRVLHKGTGPVVHKSDLVVVNYLGQIWRGKVFDSSYSRPLFGTPIGVNRVIPGWDDGLVGKTVGSRILLVIPPKYGYGSKGQSSVGIKGTDTLTFVVDVVASYPESIHGDLNATPVTSKVGAVTVSGSLSAIPKVTIPAGAAQPRSATVTLLSRGHGAKVKAGLIVLQTLVTNWQGVVQASTWALGTPDAETIGQVSSPSLLDKLIGQPLGSRFLAIIPKSGVSGPFAVVLEVVAQPHGTANQPS